MGDAFGLLISVHILVLLLMHLVVSDKPQVPCYFIFGDSLVDGGNNNKLATKWKCDYPPYGVDFPKGYTGRFTNGRTSADIIGELLDFKEFIPPYATATDKQISKGVNYASGGSGIRDESGSHNGDRIWMDRQIAHHKLTIARLSLIHRNTTFLKECIYVVNIGSNDYINNYLLSESYNTKNKYTAEQYAEILIQQYSQQQMSLYNLGARKIALFGLTQIGCTPIMVNKFGRDGKPCVKWVNDAVNLFNAKFKPLVDELNKFKSDARFTFINTAGILYPQGLLSLRTPPCCKLTGVWACIPNSDPCLSRATNIFFDSLHPSEVSNTAIATRSYKALLPTDAYPYDISNLAKI